MEQVCLVTGKSSELLAEVVHEVAAGGRKTLLARSGPLEMPVEGEGIATASWNRRSALSARSIVLHAQNLYGRLTQALIVFSPVRESVPFHESSIVSIENRTDAEVKGYLFLIRELVALFQKQRSGRIVLAVLESEAEVRSPLEAMSLGSFTSAAESLQAYYQNEPLEVRLCHARTDDVTGYAKFIAQALESPAPRRHRVEWQRFAHHAGLFGRSK
jgi:NAD(P)-dependent dehydrogenase (short-subunit alcohol dehydrogenase family)